MTRKLFTMLISYFVLTALFAFSVNGDQWNLPTKEKYFSPNKRYYVEVTPKKLESQLKYFEDKVIDREDAGAAKGTVNNCAKAMLYKLNEHGLYRRISSFPLVNEVSPVKAIVSNSGSYIATFDNWHSAGYGSDAVVIYRSDGSVIKQLALEDFLTENDIETFPTTSSSRWWGRDHYMEEKSNLLILRVLSSTESNWTGSALEGAKFYELRIDLSTGNLIKPKHDILPRWEAQVSSGVSAALTGNIEDLRPADQPCIQLNEISDSLSLIRTLSSKLIEKGISTPLPAYPPLARAARVEGSVTVEILISETGAVSCARALSGHPLLRASAVAAARKWAFAPFENSGNPGQVIGTIAFHYKFVKIVPGG